MSSIDYEQSIYVFVGLWIVFLIAFAASKPKLVRTEETKNLDVKDAKLNIGALFMWGILFGALGAMIYAIIKYKIMNMNSNKMAFGGSMYAF